MLLELDKRLIVSFLNDVSDKVYSREKASDSIAVMGADAAEERESGAQAIPPSALYEVDPPYDLGERSLQCISRFFGDVKNMESVMLKSVTTLERILHLILVVAVPVLLV